MELIWKNFADCVDQCIDGNHLDEPGFDVVPHLRDADGLILQPAPRL